MVDHVFSRFSSRRSGTLLSFQCTVSTCCQSTMCNASCTTKLSPKSATSECSVPRHSSSLRPTKDSRGNSSRPVVKLLVVSPSLPNHLLRPFPSLSLSTLCRHSPSSRRTTLKRSFYPSARSFARRTVTLE